MLPIRRCCFAWPLLLQEGLVVGGSCDKRAARRDSKHPHTHSRQQTFSPHLLLSVLLSSWLISSKGLFMDVMASGSRQCKRCATQLRGKISSRQGVGQCTSRYHRTASLSGPRCHVVCCVVFCIMPHITPPRLLNPSDRPPQHITWSGVVGHCCCWLGCAVQCQRLGLQEAGGGGRGGKHGGSFACALPAAARGCSC